VVPFDCQKPSTWGKEVKKERMIKEKKERRDGGCKEQERKMKKEEGEEEKEGRKEIFAQPINTSFFFVS
jgi:hypothetical protein